MVIFPCISVGHASKMKSMTPTHTRDLEIGDETRQGARTIILRVEGPPEGTSVWCQFERDMNNRKGFNYKFIGVKGITFVDGIPSASVKNCGNLSRVYKAEIGKFAAADHNSGAVLTSLNESEKNKIK